MAHQGWWMYAMTSSENSLDLRKGLESKIVNIGDLVQWIDGNVYKFETPRRVRAIQTLKGQEWAFVEGSATRVLLSKLTVVASASDATVARPTMVPPDPVVLGPL